MEQIFFQYLEESSIILNLKPKSKRGIISLILDSLVDIKKIDRENKKEILRHIIQREDMGSTAIGGGIALPHARLTSVKGIVVALAISKEGVNFDSLDGEKVNVIVLLISNQKEAGIHLKTLAYLAKLLKDKTFIQNLKNAQTRKEVVNLITKQENILS
ncbi:MAG: PTS sugar transporter subunit IIA [Candidatus Omnitrophota bacterium]